MCKKQKLLVSWKGPKSKQNYFVGYLTRMITENDTKYMFNYNQTVVKEAEKEGFRPFIGLSDLNKEYTNDKLFSIFERRLPNKTRHVFQQFMKDHQLNDADEAAWEYLKETKGRTATDKLSFLKPVYKHNDTLNYTGEIAGWSYTKDNNHDLQVNKPVKLTIDETNTKDRKAVEIIDQFHEHIRVGYIQKPFNQLFFKLLEAGYDLEGHITSIDPSDSRPMLGIDVALQNQIIDFQALSYLIDVTD